MPLHPILKKTARIILKSILVVFIFFILLYVIAYAYVSANKKQFVKDVTELIENKTDGKVTIDDIDITMFRSFPSIAVLVKNVDITDTLYNVHKHKFFNAEQLYVKFSMVQLLTGKKVFDNITIKNGSMFLYTDTSGYTNKYLISGKKDSTKTASKKSGNSTNLNKISIEDFKLTVADEKREKLQSFTINNVDANLVYADSIINIATRTDMLVNGLSFNTDRGTFLTNTKFNGNFDLKINTAQNQLAFDSINIKLNDQPYNLSGSFNFLPANPKFSLRIHTKNATHESVKKLLTRHIESAISIVTLTKPITASAIINGPLNGGDPYILVNFALDNTDMSTPFIDFNKASLTGYYTNEVTAGIPRKDPNSRIHINGFKAEWHGLPVNTTSIDVLNLTTPLLTADLSSSFALTKLNELLNSSAIQLADGTGSIKLSYKGPIVRNNNTNTFINGTINFKNGSIVYAPRDVTLKQVNGDMVIGNSNVLIQNLQCNVLGNQITMNGSAMNLLSLMNTTPNKVNIDWNIYSPQLNLQSFIYLLKSPKKINKKASAKNQLGNTADAIDNVIQQSNVNVTLNAKKVLYKKFTGENMNASLALLPNKYVINNVSMQSAAGNISLNGSLDNEADNRHKANLAVNMNEVDVKKVLYGFNNFGQDAITFQNLQGILNTKANVIMSINDEGEVLPQTMNGFFEFSLKKGTLINFEPIKKMKNFLLKNRNFDTVRFAELKNRMEINKGDIKINRMEIQSNIISFFVEGIYSTKGNTDVSIQVPLNNLKKRDENYKPKNKGANAKTGSSIFLRGRPGKDGNVAFKLDLFNKYKKDNKKKDPSEN